MPNGRLKTRFKARIIAGGREGLQTGSRRGRNTKTAVIGAHHTWVARERPYLVQVLRHHTVRVGKVEAQFHLNQPPSSFERILSMEIGRAHV